MVRNGERGASLLEALVAAALVIAVTSSVAQLIAWSRRATWSAGVETTAVRLAAQKLEQLRVLPWHVDSAGTLFSDDTTNLSTDPPAANGSGLGLSPAGTLDRNTPGFMDYVGVDGRWRGSGGRAPAGAAFVRRWSVVPLGADAAHSLILTVIVLPLADAPSQRGRPSRGARIQTITTRTVR